jgi:hypothetical protein
LYGVGGADLDDMLVDVIRVHAVQMTVVKIVNMAIVPNGFVSAIGAVLVGMIRVAIGGTVGHGTLSFVRCVTAECGGFDSTTSLIAIGSLAGKVSSSASSRRRLICAALAGAMGCVSRNLDTIFLLTSRYITGRWMAETISRLDV